MPLRLLLFIFYVISLCSINAAETTPIDRQPSFPNFYSWASKCDTLPHYKYLTADDKTPFILSYEEFLNTVLAFICMHKINHFKDTDVWIGLQDGEQTLNNFFSNCEIFQPFIQKHIIDAGKKIIFKGDLHGDIHSLIAFIRSLIHDGHMDETNPFKISDDSLQLVFLGDYSDKGIYGLEVLYTVLLLKLANPQQVFLVRGNHEDCLQNFSEGLFEELKIKLDGEKASDKYSLKLFKRVGQMYNFLPVCLFLGVKSPDNFINYIQCCHGGMELGHDPKHFLASEQASFELITKITRLSNSRNCLCLATQDDLQLNLRNMHLHATKDFSCIGYMWSDFIVEPTDTLLSSIRGEGIYAYGKVLTQELLAKCATEQFKICAVMRAHQQVNMWSDLMEIMLDRYDNYPGDKGCAKLWKEGENETRSFWPGIVCTLMVSPDNPLGDASLDFPANYLDYWATLQTHDNFDQWQLCISNHNIYNKQIN